MAEPALHLLKVPGSHMGGSCKIKEVVAQASDRKKALKGLTHHKFAPGVWLTIQAADR